ncbi:MAG: AAA family ATPase [Acidobacteria bacterium]|nr:AAA family ATPase [Acidobacteriota bacterium]
MPFSDVAGHVRLLDLLSRSIAGGTLPPSLLLTGPDGIGKKLTAIAVAQALNCLALRTRHSAPASGTRHDAPGTLIDSCGTCPACVRISRRVHPDVLLVEPGETGAIKIDQVRDIVDRAGYRPFEGRRRAVIVDDADALVPQAQHALLKTLEEPPPSSVFMLVTARPDVLLPTVRSRCPQLRFGPLAASDIAAALMARGQSEREARAVAATADGSLARALEASSDDLVDARERAERVLAHAAAGADPARRLEGAKALLTKAGSGAAERDHLALHLRAMAVLVRDVELLATRADARALANPDVQAALERLAPAYRGERGVRAFTAIDQALAALKGNAGAKVVADWLVLQL